MIVPSTIEGLRAELAAVGRPLVFVPTMGALHEGHLTLLREARILAGSTGTVVASIFVNPTQFGPGEDLDSYPKPLERDLALCEGEGADVVFTPGPDEIYFEDRSISVSEGRLSEGLCGERRPGHFDGVCLVVLKLFNVIGCDIAVFGKKDYQQLAIIRRMVRDLNVPVEIVGVETVREDDGLAMSSRNAYLTKAERAQAPGIRQALLKLCEAAAGGNAEVADLRANFESAIAADLPDGRIDYLGIVDRSSLEPIKTVVDRPALAACAVHLGKARLIDNVEIGPESQPDGPLVS